MNNRRLAILGIPINNVTIDEAVAAILVFIRQFREDRVSRYVSTVNSDFLAHIHFLKWGEIRYPELLNVVRNSSIITADGMPIVWVSKLLGQPLKQRVTGLDLLMPLIEVLASQNKSIFLIGGSEKLVKATESLLKIKFPKITIVGAISPYIYYQGEHLIHSEDKDILLIEQINAAKPDLLLLNLGNPKQEIWFGRVQNKLKVPITMGIGGSFEKITGGLSRAPKWMQDNGLEWLHRLYQEPARLFKRYFIDFFKMLYMAIPLIIYHNVNRTICHFFYKKEFYPLKSSLLFISPTQTIAIIPLPTEINMQNCAKLKQQIDDALQHDIVLLDFNGVIHIDLAGMALLIQELQLVRNVHNELYAFGINSDIRNLLKLHRVWDLIKNEYFSETSQTIDFLTQVKNSPGFYDNIQQSTYTLIISFLGKLENHFDYDKYFHNLMPMLNQKNVILNFRYCSQIESNGFSFLLKLKQYIEKEGRSLEIFELESYLKIQFQIAHIYSKFKYVKNLNL